MSLHQGAHALSQTPRDRHEDVSLSQWDQSLLKPAKTLDSEVPETIPPSNGTHHIPNSDTTHSRPYDAKKHSLPDTSESTQPISQSFYTTFIRKSKNHIVPENGQESAETQRTLEEGDQGHVDITSSFVTGKSDVEEDEDEEDEAQDQDLVDFSPTQSQHQLTQFPESERFKTPATAGRKRNHHGELIETPRLPQNPLRGEVPTPANTVGLSQVFAATQAASSPFSNGLPTGPRSDRPSPNVELQIKTAAGIDSSPLRPMTAFKRAVTEPASRYVSVKQSQAVRDCDVHTRDGRDGQDDDEEEEEEDTFDAEPSEVQRSKRLKARQERIHAKLRQLSSPILPRHSQANSNVNSGFDPNDNPAQLLAHLEGEAESELDEEADIERTQQLTSDIDGEDKRNQMVDVPRTVTASRLHNFVNGSITEIDASPLARQFVTPSQGLMMHSSAFQDVPNSQPGDERKKHLDYQVSSERSVEPSMKGRGRAQKSNANPYFRQQGASQGMSEGVDVRPHASDEATISDGRKRNGPTGSVHDHSAPNTVPETSSDVRQGKNGSTKSASDLTSNVTNTAQYATALITNDTASQELSSQPVSKTPPRTRRQRLLDISAEPSPMKSTPSFNAQAALQLDEDEDAAQLFSESLHGSRAVSIPSVLKNALSPEENRHSSVIPQLENRLDSTENTVLPVSPRHPARSSLQEAVSTAEPDIGRSIWDIGDSPAKPTPKANERKKMPRTAKQISRIEDRLNPKSNLTSSLPALSSGSSKSNGAVINRTSSENGDRQEEIVAPNMVFACFNGKVRAYYPAVCLGLAGSDTRKYQIQWEGYDPDEVDVHGVAGLDLRVGDAVKVNLSTFPKVPYIVQGFKDRIAKPHREITDVRGYRTLLVTPKQRKSLPSGLEPTSQTEVPVKAIYLDNNMWGQMKHRPFEYNPDQAADILEDILTPTDSARTPNTPSSRRRKQLVPTASARNIKSDGLFMNMAFAVSYDDPSRKNSLVSLIQEQKGVILSNSFDELLKPETVELQDQFAYLGFTVLLTEAYSRKEKYMQALALGLPCLSGAWIEACLQKQALVDWQTYLLPAGESSELDGAVRSRIMPPVRPDEARLPDIITARSKPLDGASVIVVVGRGKSEAKWSKYVLLIRALGAGRIEKVTDTKAAQILLSSSIFYSWIFVDDKDVSTARELLNAKSQGRKRSQVSHTPEEPAGCRIAGQELIVQSLILGQLSIRDLM